MGPGSGDKDKQKKRVIYTGWRTLYVSGFPSFFPSFILPFFSSFPLSLSAITSFPPTPDVRGDRCSSAVTVCISRITKVENHNTGVVGYSIVEITLLISVNSSFIVYHIERKIPNSVISLIRGAFLYPHG